MFRRILSGLGLICLASLLLVLPAAGSGGGSDEVNPSGIVVDDLATATCPGIDFNSIQAAVTASPPGSTIQVCPGVYDEQVVIAKRLTLKGVAHGNEDAPIVKPTAAVANTTSLASGNPIAAIILARAARNITIQNLTIDGGTSGIGGCAPNLIGIFYRNASGSVENNAVRNVALGPGLEGCQSGLGIFVQSGTESGVDPRSRVEIDSNTVHDYQKNGITGNEVGTDVSIHDNTVTGIGSTDFIAQNGIQLGFGAEGTITDNSVMNHIYGLCVDINNCSDTASNVLLFDVNGTKVEDNTIGNSQVNIYQQGDGARIKDNTVFQAVVFDGVVLVGNNNETEDNTINDSDEAGVYVDGNQNDVQENTINEAPVGILKTAGSFGSDFRHNAFFNVEMKFVTSASAKAKAHRFARAMSAVQP